MCFVSLLYTMESGPTAEMGLAGSEGVAGVALFLGGETTPKRRWRRSEAAPCR